MAWPTAASSVCSRIRLEHIDLRPADLGAPEAGKECFRSWIGRTPRQRSRSGAAGDPTARLEVPERAGAPDADRETPYGFLRPSTIRCPFLPGVIAVAGGAPTMLG
jgi:hypothetical protein